MNKSDSNFAPTFVDHHLLLDITFNGDCLINDNIPIPKKVINLYISYTLTPCLRYLNTDFTLNNLLFGSVKLTKNADPDIQKCSGYGICMNSSMRADNKKKDILILGEGKYTRIR